jgi:hypothetical protein
VRIRFLNSGTSNLRSPISDLKCEPAAAVLRWAVVSGFLFGSMLVAGGCQPAKVQDPLTRTFGGNADDQQLEFWHRLADRPVTSNDEAFHGLLIFTDGQDPATDYAGRVAALRKRGMLPADFNQPADQSVDRGTLAVALAKALKIRGGLTMSLFGPSPRYATKELEFLNLYPTSSPNQTFSGTEFLGIMAKAEEYQNPATRGDKAVNVVAAESGGPAPAAVPPAATQEAPYPPIPKSPEAPGAPER